MFSNYESIMKVFAKTVEKLKKRGEQLSGSIDQRDVQIMSLKKEQARDAAELSKCRRTAKKIEEEFIL